MFDTAASPALRVIQLTDTHIYADPAARFDGLDTRSSLARVLAASTDGGDDALFVISGDVSMDGGAAGYAWLAPRLAGIGRRVMLIPGNHDQPSTWPAGVEPGFATTPASVALGSWRLHFISTLVSGHAWGAIDAARLQELALALEREQDSHHAIFMHHPPLAVGSAWLDAMGLRNAAALWTVLARHSHVRVVACGHVHQNFDAYHAGVRVLATPSTCVQFEPRSARYRVDRRAPAYRRLDLLADGRLETEVVRVALN